MGQKIIALALVFLTGAGIAVQAQEQPPDVTDQPKELSSIARIAPKGEPGTPLVISGRIVGPDGKTPLAGVVVYAYHTDVEGNYQRTGQSGEAGESHPRLRGWAKTDEQGQFV